MSGGGDPYKPPLSAQILPTFATGLQPCVPGLAPGDATNPSLNFADPAAGPTSYSQWALKNGRFS